ncbi:MAG: hypothetical protein FJY15_05530 [Bacteroidetes bacterium]|nr:hypothetical protein [Bacteroidota bacterium]
MKQSIQKFKATSLFVAIIVSAIGCSKDSKSDKNTTQGTYSFEYTIDGVKHPWSGYPNNNQCIYLEAGPYSSASMFPQTSEGLVVSTNALWDVGTYVYDENSALTEGFALSGSNGGTSKATGGKVTVNVTEKGSGKNSHVKGNFTGIIININTLNKMNVSGNFDLCNITP